MKRVSGARTYPVEYTYDPQGRVKTLTTCRTVYANFTNGVFGSTPILDRKFIYDGWNLLAEYNVGSSDLTIARSYTWGLDIAGSKNTTGGVGALLQIHDHLASRTFAPTYDGNGNVVSVIDFATGNAVAAYEYGPFGEPLRAEKIDPTATENPFRFSTKYTDSESGLAYYGYRYYSAALGRFINRDSIEEAGGLNLYGFVSNDPINRIDFLGLTEPVVLPPFVVTGTRPPSFPPFLPPTHIPLFPDDDWELIYGFGPIYSSPERPPAEIIAQKAEELKKKRQECQGVVDQMRGLTEIFAAYARQADVRVVRNPMSGRDYRNTVLNNVVENIGDAVDTATMISPGAGLWMDALGYAGATSQVQQNAGKNDLSPVDGALYGVGTAGFIDSVSRATTGTRILTKSGRSLVRRAGVLGALVTVTEITGGPTLEYLERNRVETPVTSGMVRQAWQQIYQPMLKSLSDAFNAKGCSEILSNP